MPTPSRHRARTVRSPCPHRQVTVPTSSDVLPTKRPVLPTKRPVLPTKRPASPTKRPVLPTKRPVLPTKRPALPTKPPVLPAKRPTLPTKRPVLPAKRPVLRSHLTGTRRPHRPPLPVSWSPGHSRFPSVHPGHMWGGRGLRCFTCLGRGACLRGSRASEGLEKRLDGGRGFVSQLQPDPVSPDPVSPVSRVAAGAVGEPGCLPSRVTGFGGAWDAIGWWKRGLLGVSFHQLKVIHWSGRHLREEQLHPRHSRQ
jgi:hypothetical protein